MAARADLEGLVGAGVELDEALQEALQAHLPLEVVNSAPAADLCAMYLSLGEVPDVAPAQLYGSTRSKEKAKEATQTLIRKHLDALSKFPDDELEKALNESDEDLLAAGEEAGSVIGVNESEGFKSMDEDEEVE